MKYVKCPRCDTNYMAEGEPYCDVCKADLKIVPQIKYAAIKFQYYTNKYCIKRAKICQVF